MRQMLDALKREHTKVDVASEKARLTKEIQDGSRRRAALAANAAVCATEPIPPASVPARC